MSNKEEVFKEADNQMANTSLEFFRLPERTDAVKTDSFLAGDLGKVFEKKQNRIGAHA